jgi:2-dehydro-3-deoxyphosphogluconate aldolase / (4S)-4-hydroxy-2-oxoglutarate aldolase
MNIFERVAAIGVVPVIALDDARHALPLADALADGGLRVIEVTFRTAAAVDTIRQIAQHRPEMLVGAGTVLNEAQADAAKAAGAMFALSPGIDRAVLDHAAQIGLPFAPGIMTPSDLQIALRAECRLVKFFPAMAAGGLTMLKNIAGPYLHTGIGFNPTGGVTRENLADWLGYAPVRAVGGTWIATGADIAAENWDKIRSNAAEAAGLVSKARG